MQLSFTADVCFTFLSRNFVFEYMYSLLKIYIALFEQGQHACAHFMIIYMHICNMARLNYSL